MRYECEPNGLSRSITSLVAALVAIGIVMAFSTMTSIKTPAEPTPWWSNAAIRQAVFSLMAFGLFLTVSKINYHRWFSQRGYGISAVILALAVFLCVVVLVPGIGIERHGARRWLPLGPSFTRLGFQPSELCKPAVVLFLATYLVRCGSGLTDFRRGLLPALVIVGGSAALIAKEDFGTAALIGMVGGLMIWIAGARMRHLLALILPVGAAVFALVWLVPYRRNRILGFLDIWADPDDKGYHAVQSLLAINGGGWLGSGLGSSIQKHGYLPEAPSDFVFAVICEELGIVGGAAVIAIFACLTVQGFRAMRRAPDPVGQLVAFGVTLTIALQAMINIGVVTVCLPTKGIALPFISAGGSSALFLAISAGLLGSVARTQHLVELPPETIARKVERSEATASRGHDGAALAVASSTQ